MKQPTGENTFVGIAHNITERKKAEEALQESERRYRLLAENVTDVLWTMDMDMHFTYISPSVTRQRGYSVEEAMALGAEGSLTPESLDRATKLLLNGLLEDAKQRGPSRSWTVELELYCKDGSTIWTEMETTFLRGADGKPTGILGVARDITERRKAEAALRLRDAAIENSLNAIAMSDMRGRITHVNQACLRMWGKRRKEELLGKPYWELLIPEDATRATQIADALVSDGAWSGELVGKRPDGTEICVEVQSSLIRDNQGNPIHTISSFVDITERKQAEDALRRSEENYRLLFESTLDALIVINAETLKTVFGNRVAAKMYGFGSAEDAIGVDALNFIHPDDRKRLAGFIAVDVLEKGVGGVTGTRMVRKDGSDFWASASATRVEFRGRPAVLVSIRDITERRKMQQELRTSEMRYRLLAENMADVIWTTDMNLRFTYISPSVMALRGLTVEEAMAERLEGMCTPSSLQTLIEAFAEGVVAEAEGQHDASRSWTVEVEEYCKGGRTIWAEIRASLLRDQNGRPVGFVGATRDVSARRRADMARQQSEENFRALAEHSLDCIVVFDSAGVPVYANDRAAELTGLGPEDLIGFDLGNFFDRDEAERLLERMGRRMAGESVPNYYEATIVRKGGQRVPVEVSATPTLWQGKPAAMAVFRDITERRQAEEELRESEEHYSALVANLTDAVFKFKGGVITWCNDRVEEMYGYRKEELLGKPATFFYPRDMSPQEYVKAVSTAIKNRGLFRGADRFQRKDGTIVEIEYSLSQIPGRDPVELIAVARDVTDRVKADRAVKEYSLRLEQMVEERTRELKDAQEQLIRKERLAVLGQVAGGISHELRNPLGAIKNAAYFLNIALEKPEPEVKETLEIVNKEVATCERTISTLLDFARQKPPSRRKADINVVVQEALSRITVPQNVEVVSQLDETLPAVQADPDQLRQVFENIILNAIQAMPAGGRLGMESCTPSAGWVAVSIEDTGVGISPEKMPRLFEPLFTTKAKGIGLGLALTKMLVEAHGGTIEVESEVGKGSTFTVRLPVS